MELGGISVWPTSSHYAAVRAYNFLHWFGSYETVISDVFP